MKAFNTWSPTRGPGNANNPAAIVQEKTSMTLSLKSARTVVLAATLPLAVAGCMTVDGSQLVGSSSPSAFATAANYAALDSEKYKVEAVDVSGMGSQFLRQEVDYRTTETPGTIVVDPHKRFLYFVEKGGKAIRYGVGVGRAGLEFTGTASVQVKKTWPHWTPTSAMIAREPARYAKWAAGMEGGEGNPLGARALYLFKGGNDTRYRIHGTTEPQSIGHAVSSGCIRMMNHDIIDLYNRVPLGSRVVVL
jgi:lipoprotein-anchoring transpeptidase ErfK/SrfK